MQQLPRLTWKLFLVPQQSEPDYHATASSRADTFAVRKSHACHLSYTSLAAGRNGFKIDIMVQTLLQGSAYKVQGLQIVDIDLFTLRAQIQDQFSKRKVK